MILVKATANGTTTTITDVLNLNHQNSILVNRQGIFSGGTAANLGRVVRIESNAVSTQTATFTPTMPSATQTGDELELWNERDEGITPDAVNDLINEAILDVSETSPTPVTSDAFTFAWGEPVIDVDTLEVNDVVNGNVWEAITGVDYYDNDEEEDGYVWHRIDSADLRIDRLARTIEIRNRPRSLADSKLVRVHGANLPQTLSADSDTTPVNFEWITNHVAAIALGMRLEKAYDSKSVEGNMLRLQQRADTLRPRTLLRLRGRFWRLS